jgi:DNA-binding SARP family transcriptional activator
MRLFQFLLCHRGRRVPREQVATSLWPEAASREASARLRVTLSAAKRVLRVEQPDQPGGDLPSVVFSDGKALWLDPGADLQVDAGEFTRLIERARGIEARDPDAALEEYRRALRLYQGDFLADAAYEDWAADERERLLSLYLSAGARAAELLTDRRRYDEAVHLCQQILERDPCWEDAYYLLMRCHAEQGNRALAMRVYQRCAARLGQDLGVTPSPRTVALRDAIARASGSASSATSASL